MAAVTVVHSGVLIRVGPIAQGDDGGIPGHLGLIDQDGVIEPSLRSLQEVRQRIGGQQTVFQDHPVG